jgi:hypothetical protein
MPLGLPPPERGAFSWESSSVGNLPMQQPTKLFSLDVCHHNNLWVEILVPYFFTV